MYDTVKFINGSTLWELCDRKGEVSQIQMATNQAIMLREKKLQKKKTKTPAMVTYYGKRGNMTPPVTISNV